VIVPRHLWSEVDDPMTFTNDQPVGTGPYMLKSFNGQELVVERNPTYWQADKIRVQELVFTKASEGQVNQLRLAEGAYDWNAMFVPDIENSYVAKDPEHNKYWFPQGGVISLYLNLTMAPFDDVEFRRGLAYAIDREEIRQKAQFGYVDVATQVGLNLPGHQDYLDPSIPNQGFVPYDPAKALEILNAAGYTREGDGPLKGKDGQEVQFTFSVQSGWNDWVQAAEVIREDLAAIGITMDVQAGTPDIVIADRASGNFEATFGVFGGTCSMYSNFADPLASERTKPVGEEATSNFVRWQDPETDQLLAQLRAAPDAETQKPILYQLEQIMYNEVPVIPLWYGARWFEYRTANAVGWPSAEDPYALPEQMLLVLTHLQPAPQQ
jgi:peptide/nickel transport system substrate-binding protein